MKIAFVGGGNMGEAMLATVLKTLPKPHGISINDISVSDTSDERRIYIEQKYFYSEYGRKFNMTVMDSNPKAVMGADIIILAIKPQSLAEVLTELGGTLKPRQLVLSIIAGARIKKLRSGLKHQRIVRAMPNTPVQIGEGITVWTATPQVTERQKKLASSILGAMGQEIYTTDEKHLDMATAVSGSGPAYFFYFVEALTESAVQLGLPRDMAGKLVLQTMLGAAGLIQQSGKLPAELRRMVTSPGGTTAAAIQSLEAGNFHRLIMEAVKAAHKRAKELGK